MEKLFELAINLSNGEAEAEGGDKKKGKASKKEDKKAAKGKGKDEPEVVKEPTKYELE